MIRCGAHPQEEEKPAPFTKNVKGCGTQALPTHRGVATRRSEERFLPAVDPVEPSGMQETQMTGEEHLQEEEKPAPFTKNVKGCGTQALPNHREAASRQPSPVKNSCQGSTSLLMDYVKEVP